MMHCYIRKFSILIFVALSVSSAVTTASGADDATAGLMALSRGEYDEAIRLSTRALESGELSPEIRANVLSNRGLAWSGKKNYDHAIADYNEALRLNPQDAIAFYSRAIAWCGKKDYDRAIADDSEALRLNPQYEQAFHYRGYAWSEKKDYDRAIADYNEALRLNPQDTETFFSRGFAWFKKQDYDRAIADYSEALRLNPQYAYAFNNRGIAWCVKNAYGRAIADFNEALRLNPQDAIAFYSRGNAWTDEKEYDRAVADYNEALRLNPQYADAFHNRGLAQFHQARFGLAATDLAQWQKLNPDDAYAAIWLYLARARSGAKDAASQLAANARHLKADGWPAPVVALFTGQSGPQAVRDQAANADPEVQKSQMCEANFYLGQWHLLKHQKEEARALFRQAQDECPKSFQNECPKGFVEYDSAVAELKRM